MIALAARESGMTTIISFAVSIWFFVIMAFVSFADDCRYDRNCGMYSQEPYEVNYTFPQDTNWDYLKDFRDGVTSVKLIPENEVWEQEPGVIFNISDCFEYSKRIYTYTRHIEDDEDRTRLLKIEWSAHYYRRRRLFAGHRIFTNFLRITIDDRLLMLVDDDVRPGRYWHRDYFALGEKQYRITIDMTSEPLDYYCIRVLLESPPY